MSNSALMDAFTKALRLGNTIPQGQDRGVLETLTRQYAETHKISYTEEELQEVLDFAIANFPLNEQSTYEFPENKMMK